MTGADNHIITMESSGRQLHFLADAMKTKTL